MGASNLVAMVLVGSDQFRHEVYDRVKSGSASGSSTVVLFVAQDVDSICTCRVLEALFKCDAILFSVVPVTGYQELEVEYQEYVEKSDEVRTVFMINCGAIHDLQVAFGGIRENISIFVIDCHRPLRYENVTSEQIFILDDGSSADAIRRLDEDDEGRRQRQRTGEDGAFVETPPMEAKAPISPRSRAKRRNRLFREYYTGSYFGPPSAGLAYTLSLQLGKSDRELLWLAIVGLTEQYVMKRVDQHKYVEQVNEYQDEVNRICSGEGEKEEGSSGSSEIKFEEEYQFTLYRHWNLYDSVHHSSYVANKFEVWTSAGQKRLKEMFAKMGVSLEEAKQRFSHMSPSVKESLQRYVDPVGREFGLEDVFYGSFHLKQGYRFQISAADVVQSVSAILARAPNVSEGSEKYDEDFLRRNFWLAHDSMSSLKSTQKIEQGIESAISLHKSVLKNASHMLLKKTITVSGVFRYAYLKDTADVHLFVNPHALTQLALFLATYFKEKHANRKPKPFVLCAANEARETYLVVAIDGAFSTISDSRNKFGTSFAKAAERTNARVKHDAFDSSIIEIQKEDIYNFMEFLHSGLC